MSALEPLLVHRCAIRIRYADTDQMQIVYHGNYLEYFEIGRTEFLRDLGLPYAAIEASGIRLLVIEAHCRYIIPAVYDDLIIVESSMFEMPTARMRIDYNILRGDTLLATGYTMHAFQDVRLNRPVRPPAVFLETLKKGFESAVVG